jgi:hypothetical protein
MRAFLILLVVLFAFSCKKDSVNADSEDEAKGAKVDVCDIKDPVNELPWLKKIIEDVKAKKEQNITTITLVEVKGRPVFNYYVSYMSCIGCISYYCDGSRLDMSSYSQEELREYQDNIWGTGGKRKVIWPE